jgi:hypothetical protein
MMSAITFFLLAHAVVVLWLFRQRTRRKSNGH